MYKLLQVGSQINNVVKKILSSDNIFLWDISTKNIKIRLSIVSCCFALCFCGLSYRLIIVATSGYVKQSEYQVKNSNFRKEIVDRHGNLLAVSLPSSSLFANPQKIINPEESVEKLATIVPNLDRTKLLAELKSSKNFVWVKRDLFPKEQASIFNLGMPGFDFEPEQKRIYPFANLLSHVIGYVGRDLIGLAGLEQTYNKFLTNSDANLRQADQYKRPLELSIDVRLQYILHEEIDKTCKEFNAIGAVGIIANPNNGEILALVSKPDFDPHHPGKAKAEQLFNTASLGVYEMGSVFKALTMAFGFDTNSITMHDAYDLSYMKVGGFQIKDYYPKFGWHSVPEIFRSSSNIGVSQIILEVGNTTFKKYLKTLGLLDQLCIELPERGTPLIPPDQRWNELSMVTMSYGYGISISPLHLVQAILPVVNGGILYDLTLIKRKDEPLVGTRIFSENTSKQMSKLLRLVVKEGTGRKAKIQGYDIGGKTGTTEKLSSNKHGKKKYLKNRTRSSFLGILPASNPQYVIYIMFDEPKGTKESFGFAGGGWTAAPTVRKVFERMIALYGIEGSNREKRL